jgi:hypothetical protein
MCSGWPYDSAAAIRCSTPLPAEFGPVPKKLRDRRREQQQARGEDRRNHAGHVQLERQVRGLAPIRRRPTWRLA